MKLELEVMHLNNEDVIATSCNEVKYEVDADTYLLIDGVKSTGEVFLDVGEGHQGKGHKVANDQGKVVGKAEKDRFPNKNPETGKIYHWDSDNDRFIACEYGCNE